MPPDMHKFYKFYSELRNDECLLTLYKPFKGSFQMTNIRISTDTLLNNYKVAEYNHTHAKLMNRIKPSVLPYYLVSYNALLECMSPAVNSRIAEFPQLNQTDSFTIVEGKLL